MRKKRYLEKLEWIENEVEFTASQNFHDDVERRAVLYSILTAVEATMDLVAMLTKDLGFSVEDDHTNINKLHSEGIIEEEEAELLRRFNGLRNAIAHHYNHLDLSRVEDSIAHLNELYGVAVKLVKIGEKL